MVMLILVTEFILSPDSSPVVIWLIMAISIVLGVFIGFVAMKLPRIGVTFGGIWLGFIISLLAQNAFLYKLSDSNAPFYIVAGILCFGFAVAGWFYFDIVLIAVTSLFGVYLNYNLRPT